jgi:hypothetical protein
VRVGTQVAGRTTELRTGKLSLRSAMTGKRVGREGERSGFVGKKNSGAVFSYGRAWARVVGAERGWRRARVAVAGSGLGDTTAGYSGEEACRRVGQPRRGRVLRALGRAGGWGAVQTAHTGGLRMPRASWVAEGHAGAWAAEKVERALGGPAQPRERRGARVGC